MRRLIELSRHAAVRSITGIALLTAICVAYSFAQTPKPKKASPTVEKYTRPQPVKPVAPQIPSMDRSNPNKFFLEQADILYAIDGDSTGKQIVSGNVIFRKQGMIMYCDSAFYYPASSSLEAFGNVRMEEGDSIVVKADYANYDGFTEQAQLQSREFGHNVFLQHTSHGDKTIKTLETDVLDYNTITGEAAYYTGGRLLNRSLTSSEVDTLTSNVGTYNTVSRLAEVTENVFLRNANSRLRTERLLYHADTRLVEIVELATIASDTDSIVTRSGQYDSGSGNAVLYTRSLIAHKDSSGNVTTLEGDSIVYDNFSRVSEAFMTRNPSRPAFPMVITDTARKAILIGGYGYYNDSTREAYAENYPLLKEYSRSDTLFLRAEKVLLETKNLGVKPLPKDSLPADSLSENIDFPEPEYHIAKAFNRARFFRSDLQGLADSITFVSLDSMLYLNRKPIVWSGDRLVSGPVIQVHFNDSTPDWALLPRKGIVTEAIEEGFYNQLRAGYVRADFAPSGDLDHILAHTDVQTIFLPQEKDSTYNKLVNAVGDTLYVNMTGKEMDKLKLWTRGGAKISGTVTPLMSITKQQYYLPDFISMAGGKRFSEMDSLLSRLEKLRPTYNVYRHGWSDDLGELSFELEDYFNDPSVGIPDDTPVVPRPPSSRRLSQATVPNPSSEEVKEKEPEEKEGGNESSSNENEGNPNVEEKQLEAIP